MADDRPIGPEDLCEICLTPNNAAHASRAHVFTPYGSRVDTSQFGPKRSERRDQGTVEGERRGTPYNVPQTGNHGGSVPFDPVLRKALIDKGIITVEDLTRASQEIQAFTQAVTGGYDAGTGTSTIRSDAPEPGVRSAE